MFSRDKKQNNREQKTSERNLIGKQTKIIGDIVSGGDFRIDGTLEGTLKTQGKLIVGIDGAIEGKVFCSNADIEGKVSGNLQVTNTLTLKATSNVLGDVVIGKLSVEPGANFNATCTMKGAVKELSKKEEKKLAEKTA